MKKFLLSLSVLLGAASASVYADNVADFNTFNNGSAATSYGTYTTSSGWEAVNSAIVKLDDGTLAPTLNGKISAVGTLSSPELSDGIGSLSFKYQNTYKENNGAHLKIEIIQNEEVVKSAELENTSMDQKTEYSYTSPDFDVEGAFQIVITNLSPSNSTSNKDRVSIYDLTWTNYSAGEGPKVLTPTFEMVKGDNGYVVKINCESEGASIYYTSGAEAPEAPSKSSTLYSAPVSVSGQTYFKAIAYVGENASNVASFTANPPMVVNNFAALDGLTEDTDVDVMATLYGVYQNGDNTYVYDSNNNGMLIYGSNPPAVSNGSTIDGLSGVFTIYNGQTEIKNFSFGEITEGTSKIEPTVITVSQIEGMQLNKYVKLSGVTIQNTSGAKYEISDASGNTAVMYNKFTNSSKFDVVEVPDGENFTIIGFIAKNYDTMQLCPISIEGGEVMEQVETPVIEPGSGQLEANTEITITCATEGATIYYTVDSSEPTAESLEYTAPIKFTEAMTLKAVAVKEGMLNSGVAEAVYTLLDPNAPELQTVTFDFTDPSLYGIEVPSAGSGTDLCEKGGSVDFTEGDVTLTFAASEDASNLPRIWGKKSGDSVLYDVRVYAGATVTFTATKENEKIQKIEFIQNTGSTDWAANNTYVPATFNRDNKSWNAEEVDAPAATFEMVPAAKSFFAKAIVTLATSSEISTIESDENAEAVYYNLQGVRVANPSNGLYIVVKGNKSSKVIF